MDKDLPRRLWRHKHTRRIAAGLAVFILGTAVLAALTAPKEAAPQSRRVVREMPPFQTASAENKSSYWLEEAVHEGDTVTAHARLQYQGNTLHEWHIDIVNTNDELISTVHVTNYIMKTSAPRK